tara:strand:- start:113818 stop:114321 length:504 start_codon:yes stop_codon:yes gene_type:complete
MIHKHGSGVFMKKIFLATYMLSSVAYATCYQSPETTCLKDKDLDLVMTYTTGGCSPPGGPVTHFSQMQISSISDPSKKLVIQKPMGPRNVILKQSLLGIIPLNPINDLESILIIQKDINGHKLTLKSDAFPSLDTLVNTPIKYKCEKVDLKWGRKMVRPPGPRRIEM